ncbi:hypothetical protein, conserved [Angomonas deanei]|uniref:Uncharacterized protein n=1 Tax=Angomonas deanei TaxID=59799 RepID=A0A7G2C7E6_9TRYP|nr:hypothetical protein, conserved [Angomonas deanei]
MDLSCFAHGGDEKLGHDVRQGNVDFDTLEKKVQKYAPTLPLDEQDERIEQVRASIKLLGEVGAKSVCSTTPVWRSSLREEKTPPTTFLEQFLIQLSLSKPPSQSSTKEKVMAPFVCRICRKDQRTGMSVPQTAPDKQANAPKKGRNLPAVKPPRKR